MSRYDYDTYFVYELIDPRPPGGAVFYIGKTATPRERLNAHKGSPDSAAYARICEIRQAGFEVQMYCIGRFNTEAEALDYESYLIRKTPNLVNRLGYHHPTETFVRPVLDVGDLHYVTTEEQPIPDEDTVIAALAAQLPHISIDHIREIVIAQSALLSEDCEYAGVTDE